MQRRKWRGIASVGCVDACQRPGGRSPVGAIVTPEHAELAEPDAPRRPNVGSSSPTSPGSPGTSEATASRALKDDPRIGEATRAAVRAAAQKLGYVPNAAARSLRARRTHILGLLLDDLADPVHGKVAAGFEEAAAGQGYAVFMMTGLHDREREQRALTAFVEHRADGIALASCVSDPSRCLPAPAEATGSSSSSPTIPPSRTAPSRRPGACSAATTPGGFAAAVEHLVERGYRRITYVGPGSGLGRRLAPCDGERGHRCATASAGYASSTAGADGWRDASDGRRTPGRGSARGGHLLRRQARAEPARRAALDPARRPARPRRSSASTGSRPPASHGRA